LLLSVATTSQSPRLISSVTMKDGISSGEDTPVSMGKEQVEMREHTLSDAPVEFDTKSSKRLLRKIDFALIPFLSLLYL
jgi:hypothetical protein